MAMAHAPLVLPLLLCLAFLACHPLGAVGDECMHGPHRTKLLDAGAFGTLLRAALSSVLEEECDMIVQQARAGCLYVGGRGQSGGARRCSAHESSSRACIQELLVRGGEEYDDV